MNPLYVPSECPATCKLDQRTIGRTQAFVIAALYDPYGNKSLARRQAEAVIGRPIANSSFLRHVDHLRLSNERSAPDPDGPLTFETRQEAIASLRNSMAESVAGNNGDPWGWDLAIAAVQATTDDEPWQDAYDAIINGLGLSDQAET